MHVQVFQTGIILMFGYRPEYSLWKEALRSANSYLLQLSGITEDIWDRKPMLLIRVIFRDAFQEIAVIFFRESNTMRRLPYGIMCTKAILGQEMTFE